MRPVSGKPAVDDGRPHLVTLIPTYNEAGNIVLMLDAIAEVGKALPRYRTSTLVVDDESPDGTGELVRKYSSSHPATLLFSRPRQGLGNAMKAGYLYAVAELNADVVVTLDCDFQWDPADIPRLLAALEGGSDAAIASRHAAHGKIVGWPLGRRLTHWIANTFFATYVAGTREVLDHNGNFRAIRVEGCLDRIDFRHLPVRGYAFFNLMIYEMTKLGVRFSEVPVTFGWRQVGEAKVSFSPCYCKIFLRDTFEYIRLCLVIRWDRLRRSS
jgi:dolichol-phosphate mannosyltransferase